MTSWILEIWSSSLAPGKRGCRLRGREGLWLESSPPSWSSVTRSPVTPTQSNSRPWSVREGGTRRLWLQWHHPSE